MPFFRRAAILKDFIDIPRLHRVPIWTPRLMRPRGFDHPKNRRQNTENPQKRCVRAQKP
jgi:hypothetical protein